MRKAVTLILMLTIVVAILTGCAAAGSVSGVVKGDDGKIVSGATVQLGSLSATTDSTGHFTFDKVKAGNYVLKVSADGADPYKKNITVSKKGLTVNVTLKFNSLAKVKRAGVLTVGADTTYPPFEWIDTKKGQPVGFDIDLANLIAEKLGVKAKIISTAWDGIIPALKSGKFDVIISAMTITPERAKEIDFSIPYYDSGQIIAVRKDNTAIHGPQDLAGKVVGVQTGTTGEEAAKKIKGIKIKEYPDIQYAFTDLEMGRIDAVVNDLPVSAYFIKTHPNLKLVGKLFTVEHYGIAFRKDEKALKEAINNILKQIKSDGEYDQLYEKWFGKKPED